MKPMHSITPDYAREINRTLRARRRNTVLAASGAALFCVVTGLALGCLAASGGHLLFLIAISCWGTWGLRYLLTRH